MSGVPAAPRVWYFDTCTLMSMQVSTDLNQLMKQQLAGEFVVLLQEVVDELNQLVTNQVSGSGLAAQALADLAWLGAPELAESFAETADIVHWQAEVADGRPYGPDEHWAESCIIASAETQPEEDGVVLFLSEEYSARICGNKVAHCTPMSVHRYMYELVQAGLLDANQALSIACELEAADRGPECRLSDFTDPTPRGLGRMGKP
jgi:hypothetical protein